MTVTYDFDILYGRASRNHGDFNATGYSSRSRDVGPPALAMLGLVPGVTEWNHHIQFVVD